MPRRPYRRRYRRRRGTYAAAAILLALTVLVVGPAPPVESEQDRTEPLYPDLAESAPPLSARSAILIDARTGSVLYARRAEEPRPPASTTKMMTALLAVEFGHTDDVVVVSRRAARTGGSSMGLRAGDRFPLEQLLYGLMLPSGNDAAVAIAEHISGSLPRFVALMNERARQLDMRRTHFVNPHGLTQPGHASSAYDLAMLTREALHHPALRTLICTRTHEACDATGERRLRLHNTNLLLWSYPWIEGGKTGTTSAAGRCLIAVASRAGQRWIAVVLNAPRRWGDARALLEWGFDTFNEVDVARSGDVVGWAAVEGGTRTRVPLVLGGDLAAVTPAGVTPTLRLSLDRDPTNAPVWAFRPLGWAALVVDGRVVVREPVMAAYEVGRRTWFRALIAWIAPWLRWLGPS